MRIGVWQWHKHEGEKGTQINMIILDVVCTLFVGQCWLSWPPSLEIRPIPRDLFPETAPGRPEFIRLQLCVCVAFCLS